MKLETMTIDELTIDDKGKFFTDRVSTQRVPVLIFTVNGEVRGHAHVRPGQRIKDLLNNGDEQFIALEHATIRGHNEDVKQAHFIALNKRHIISVMPAQDADETGGEEE